MYLMKAYNKRLDHIAEIASIDFIANKVKLLQPQSSPKFYYHENMSNITIIESSGINIDGKDIYEGDKVKDEIGNIYTVVRKPGGFYPFVSPVKTIFKKA